jgi:hypothetical protein
MKILRKKPNHTVESAKKKEALEWLKQELIKTGIMEDSADRLSEMIISGVCYRLNHPRYLIDTYFFIRERLTRWGALKLVWFLMWRYPHL